MVLLGESLLLIALDDEEGKVGGGWNTSTRLPYVLAGTLLAELALLGRVESQGKHFVVTDPSPTEDEILDEALARMVASKKPRDGTHWVNDFNGKVKHLKERLLARLVTEGTLRHEEKKVLLIFPSPRYPTSDATLERALRDDLLAALEGREPVDTSTAVLLSFVKAADLMGVLVPDKSQRKAAEQRVDAILKDEHLSSIAGASKAAADAAAAAVMAATIAATTAATASANN